MGKSLLNFPCRDTWRLSQSLRGLSTVNPKNAHITIVCTPALMDRDTLIVLIVWLLLRLRAIRLVASAMVLMYSSYRPSRQYRKYKKKMRAMFTRPRTSIILRRHRTQPPREQGDFRSVNVFQTTGLFEDQFEEIFRQVQHLIMQPRVGTHSTRVTKTSLSPRFRLLLVLEFLRHYPRYFVLAKLYNISVSQVGREIYHIIPKLCANIHYISWPLVWRPHTCLGDWRISAAIDCTSHFRNRVHPRQADWYGTLHMQNILGCWFFISLFPLYSHVHLLSGTGGTNAGFS